MYFKKLLMLVLICLLTACSTTDDTDYPIESKVYNAGSDTTPQHAIHTFVKHETPKHYLVT